MKMLSKIAIGLVSALLALALVAVLWALASARIEPVAWQPGPNPGLTGAFAVNDRLAGVRLLAHGDGVGPEAIALGPDGRFYTGYVDGRIVRLALSPDDTAADVEEFANTGGRPLGMAFDRGGNLLVADGRKGLLSISPAGRIEVLVDTVDGAPLRFANDLDIAADGTVWFSDLSQRYKQGELGFDLLEASATGRLLSYTPATGQTRVHLHSLYAANGVALGPDDTFVLVAEMGAARIQRLWLTGSRAGESEVFIAGLPGLPDNITFNGNDTFLVALPSLRNARVEALATRPWLRKLFSSPPLAMLEPSNRFGMVLELDLDGRVRSNLQSPGIYMPITSALQWQDKLVLGSNAMDAVGLVPLN
jgi:sugar lactone lactonase YvrE